MSDVNDRPRILYVEDEPLIRKIVSILFQRAGFDVRTAGDGNEGVAVALEWRPDIILMDLMMPGMNGLDAARALRADPRAPRVPILAYSAAAEGSFRSRALEAGMDDFISKSSPHPELIRIARTRLAAAAGAANVSPS